MGVAVAKPASAFRKENSILSAEQTDAIILRTFPWSETSLVVHLYTREFGKRSMLAKGARRPKSPFEAALDLLSFSRVVFISKSGDTLDILTEAKLEQRFRGGTQDLLRLYCGYYVAELLDKLTEKGERQPEVFELALATLQALANPGLEIRAIVLRFELQMLRCLGQLLSFRRCAQCGIEVDDSPALGNRLQQTQTKSRPGGLSHGGYVFGLIAGGVLCADCQRVRLKWFGYRPQVDTRWRATVDRIGENSISANIRWGIARQFAS